MPDPERLFPEKSARPLEERVAELERNMTMVVEVLNLHREFIDNYGVVLLNGKQEEPVSRGSGARATGADEGRTGDDGRGADSPQAEPSDS